MLLVDTKCMSKTLIHYILILSCQQATMVYKFWVDETDRSTAVDSQVAIAFQTEATVEKVLSTLA